MFRKNHRQKGTSRSYRICAISYTEVNARAIHDNTLQFFTQPSFRPKPDEVQVLLKEIPETHQTEFIVDLAKTWSSLKRKCSTLSKYYIENLPNLAFTLVHPENGCSIKVVRFRSPDLCPDSKHIDPKYQAMLEYYSTYQKKHIDLCLVSPSFFPPEEEVHQLRYEVQFKFPEALLSWGADTYSRFAFQENQTDLLSARRFIGEFIHKIRSEDELCLTIPQDFFDENKMKTILNRVHSEIFNSKRNLTISERRDFIVIALVYILESFCDEFRPHSLDTACRSHIDRGMVITALLYQYLLIKSHNIDHEEYLSYFKTLIFPPSLLAAQRPTHICRISRLLSAMSRLFDPDVINRIQVNESCFTRFTVSLPPAG